LFVRYNTDDDVDNEEDDEEDDENENGGTATRAILLAGLATRILSSLRFIAIKRDRADSIVISSSPIHPRNARSKRAVEIFGGDGGAWLPVLMVFPRVRATAPAPNKDRCIYLSFHPAAYLSLHLFIYLYLSSSVRRSARIAVYLPAFGRASPDLYRF